MTEPAEPAPRRKKPFWKSKTFWVSVVTAAAPALSPAASGWIAANPQATAAGVGAVFAALRWMTSEPVGAKGDG